MQRKTEMSANRQLHIGLSLTGTWQAGRPLDEEELRRSKADPVGLYVRLSRMAEQAKLDFVFKPDTLSMFRRPSGGEHGFGGMDATVLMAALARETEKIGLVTTASTTFNPPYVVARQVQSLHRLSKGRAGWNIVTSIEGADNFSDAPMPAPEERYRKAAEFTQVVRALWQSFPHAATDGLAQPAPIDHKGEFFNVKGPLNVAEDEAGPPPLFQAGASDVGRAFAASVANATFAATPDMAAGVELRTDLRRRAAQCGRSADAVRVLPGLYFFLARTREEAWEMHHRAHAHLSVGHRLDAVHSVLGLDIRHLSPEDRVRARMLPDSDQPVRSRTHADLLRRFIEAHEPTVDMLLQRPEVVGSAHWVSVGTVEDVMNDMIAWHEAGAMDGVIALPGGSFNSLEIFLDELVPALAARGLFRRDYEGATLKSHLGL